jgi:SulP family sulfate permease
MAKTIARQYAVLSGHEILIVDLSDVPSLGVSSSLALEKIVLEDMQEGRPVYLAGLSDSVRSRLGKLGLLQKVPPDHIFATRTEALARASSQLEDSADESATAGAEAEEAGH